jgi:hypothetical protein
MRLKFQPLLPPRALHVFELCKVRVSGYCELNLLLPSFPFIFTNIFKIRFAQQHATCTSGPSLPSHIPDATARHCDSQGMAQRVPCGLLTRPRDLITKVHVPMKFRITKPPNTVLISGIPLCLAYNAYSFTNTLAVAARPTLNAISDEIFSPKKIRVTH